MADTNHTTISIEGTTLPVLEHAGHRVVTLGMIDTVHGRPSGTARKRFNDNKARFVEGEDYWKITASEFRTRFPSLLPDRASGEVILAGEAGYLMLVKSFTDDLAWKVQRQLVNAYFRHKASEATDPGAIEQRPWHQRPLEERNVRASTGDAAAIIEPRPQRLRAIDQGQSMLALAEQMCVDFVTLSPVQPTLTHPDAQPLGWEQASTLIEGFSKPVFLLGGVGPAEREKAWGVGAQGVAGIRAFWPEA